MIQQFLKEDGKIRDGLVLIMIFLFLGFIMLILNGFTSMSRKREVFGYGRKVLDGYGVERKTSHIVSHICPMIGFISTSKSLGLENTMTSKTEAGKTCNKLKIKDII